MSSKATWNIDKYREEHESAEHWALRRAFIERWHGYFPEERLIFLAGVFINIEFKGRKYPEEIMKEVANLSKEVARPYCDQNKTKLQQTFVSASVAAGDIEVKGIKRVGGIVEDGPPPSKSKHIGFVKQGEMSTEVSEVTSQRSYKKVFKPNTVASSSSGFIDTKLYLNELLNLNCVGIDMFRDSMFLTNYGKLVLLVRPWVSKLSNLQASCQACKIEIRSVYDNNKFTILVNGAVLSQGHGHNKQLAKQAAEQLAWEKIKSEVISLLIKEQWIAQGDARIGVDDVADRKQRDDTIGTPIESSVASKMMQMMGWKGGGLGAESQGIAEPIKPNLQMVNRAGLGSVTTDIRALKRAAWSLMTRYIASSSLDVDLVFSTDFNNEERAAIHRCALKNGLASKSYGNRPDRFVVVKKKQDPFAIVKAAIKEGGNTAKYQVFIPIALGRKTGG